MLNWRISWGWFSSSADEELVISDEEVKGDAERLPLHSSKNWEDLSTKFSVSGTVEERAGRY